MAAIEFFFWVTFFIHLADAFIQSDLLIQAIIFLHCYIEFIVFWQELLVFPFLFTILIVKTVCKPCVNCGNEELSISTFDALCVKDL